MLDENLEVICREAGTWRTGHQLETKDLPGDQPGDNRFVIANSLTGVVFGPFEQTQAQYYHAEGESFMRKEEGTRQVYPVTCHWLMDLDQVDHDYQITRGLPWTLAAKVMDVAQEEWWRLRRLQMSDAQFENLCQELRGLNRNRSLQVQIGQRIYGLAEEELAELGYYDEEGAPEYWESWVRDEFFDGDEAMEEAFWDSQDDD